MDIREKLAIYAHFTWSKWMKHLFDKCEWRDNGTVLIPKWAVDRWLRQACTSYENLTKREKESDLKEADKILEIING